jgi:hypothetical protein
MTPLEQKLQQLRLKVISHQIEATIAEAAGQESQRVRYSGVARRYGTGSS